MASKEEAKVTMSGQAGEKRKLRGMLLKTACNGLTLFIIGMSISMKGPSFIDLQLISNTDVEKGSAYFTATAFGYMAGSLLGGGLISKIKSKTLLIAIPMIISAFFFALTPWCTSFVSMLIVHILAPLFMAICETTVNVEEIHAWEGNSDSAMQFLSFAYSLGGIVGPLIVEPFLAPKQSEDANVGSNETDHYKMSAVSTLISRHNNDTAYFDYNNRTDLDFSNAHHHLYQVGTDNTSVGNTSAAIKGLVFGSQNRTLETDSDQMNLESEIHYAYLIGGILGVVAMVPYGILYIRTHRTNKSKSENSVANNKSVRKLPLKIFIFLTGLISSFYFFYTTVDDPFSMYLSIFVVSHLKWSKEDGALVSSLYWGCSTVTKLALVILVRRINPSIVLLLSTIGMTVSMTVLTVCAHFQVHVMIWICSAMLALSQSAVFGGGMAWADANLLKCDGRVTSSIMIFASLGAMLDPMLLGVTMKELSPMAFPYILTFQAFITFLICFIMLVIVKPIVHRKYGPPRPAISVDVSEDQNECNQDEDEIKVIYSNGCSIEAKSKEEDESLMP